VCKARDGECASEALAVVGGVDADHINFARWLGVAMMVCDGMVVVVRVGMVVVMCDGVVVVVCVGIGMHLRPTETGDTTIDFMNEEAVWIEPRFGEALGEHIVIPIALFRVAREGAGIHCEPLVIVGTWSECPGGKAIG
jgi:hypothetical protein